MGAQMQEHLGDRDADRADRLAGAAERGRERKTCAVVIGFQPRPGDGADGSRVYGAVGMAPDRLVDRAHVEARTAADAGERAARGCVREHAGATGVDEDDVKLVTGKTYPFGLGVHDNAGGINHTITSDVYLLKFD